MALSSVVGRGAPLLPWSPGLGCVPSADEVCGVGVQVGVRCRASPNHRPPWHSIFALSLDTIVLIHCRLYQTTSHHAHSPSRSSAWSACPRQPSHRRCLRRGTLLAATPCRQPIRPTALSPALPPPDQEPSRVSHGLTHPPDGLSVTCFAPYCPCHLPAITPLPRAPRRRYNPCVTGLVSRTIYAVRRAAPAWVPLHPPPPPPFCILSLPRGPAADDDAARRRNRHWPPPYRLGSTSFTRLGMHNPSSLPVQLLRCADRGRGGGECMCMCMMHAPCICSVSPSPQPSLTTRQVA